MPHAALAVAFWFLATASTSSGLHIEPGWSNNTISSATTTGTLVYGNSFCQTSSAPVALGPYPTAAMCEAAERLVAPGDRTLWTPERRAKWKAYDRAKKRSETSYERYNARMNQLAKENPKPGRYRLWDGTVFDVYRYGGDWDQSHPFVATPIDNHHIGRSIPRGIPSPDPPEALKPDTYTIAQRCEPVKGWYATVQK
jgi:hypothetical protein